MSGRSPATCYLLHFVVLYRHAHHYLGPTTDQEQRPAGTELAPEHDSSRS